MEPFKNLYNDTFFNGLTSVLSKTLKDFDKKQFLKKIYDKDWEARELKQRMKHIAETLHGFMPANYDIAVKQLYKIIDALRKEGKNGALEHMIFTEYVEKYGIDHYDTSMEAIEFITQFISCEFAIRPFIIRYQAKAMKQMLKWSKHESFHVRRLSSEGCRPRLPWAMALPALKKDPSTILPILENLKDDPAEFVRKSVANNLNDIAKDNVDIVLDLVKRWQGKSPRTDWIIKHGSRTLLRKANPQAMKLFGLAVADKVVVDKLKITDKSIGIGSTLLFAFELTNKGDQPIKLRVEYGIDYVKSGGKASRKLFKITENIYQPHKTVAFKRAQSFRNLTTRKHYAGVHTLSVVINGQELATKKFEVTE
ncbi:DNA alkylation repair protein [Paraflavitalea sp. CAU 1676]|uniref:DNA alkylation repair protein n=1 Tax=Paraflavitalea sp. CAU 1676 TaxID=3032598 RepID=UPI0023DBAA0F|nr:DNA alkylation repair protein [Paraflavitalea sp. CAU 1676]MDF2191848.1 DNA alkylation repair protein [Paraflavitalea sp. CAU 1676]